MSVRVSIVSVASLMARQLDRDMDRFRERLMEVREMMQLLTANLPRDDESLLRNEAILSSLEGQFSRLEARVHSLVVVVLPIPGSKLAWPLGLSSGAAAA